MLATIASSNQLAFIVAAWRPTHTGVFDAIHDYPGNHDASGRFEGIMLTMSALWSIVPLRLRCRHFSALPLQPDVEAKHLSLVCISTGDRERKVQRNRGRAHRGDGDAEAD